MNELKPVAVIYVDEEKVGLHGRRISWLENPMSISEETKLYALPDTHRVVSVEDLKNVADKLDFWINRDDTRSMSESEYKSWLALGHQSKTVTRLRAIIDNKGA